MIITEKILAAAIDPFEGEMTVALAKAYVEHHKDWLNRVRLISAEGHVETRLVDLESDKIPRQFRLHGFIDKMLWDPRVGKLILDHKTTSEDVADPNNRYWKRLINDPQSTTYMLLCLANGTEVDGIVWDLLKKPSIRPKQISKDDLKKLVNDRLYAGHVVPRLLSDIERLAPQVDVYADGSPKRAESPYLYGLRVAQWARANADKVFIQRTVNRTMEDVAELNQSILGTSKMIRWCVRNKTWPQNTRSCYLYNRPCDYYEVCHGCSSLDGPEFVDRDKDMFKLSHSVLGDFYNCPRKFKYSRVDRKALARDDDENLRIGSLWHTALDAIFEQFVKPYDEKEAHEQAQGQAG